MRAAGSVCEAAPDDFDLLPELAAGVEQALGADALDLGDHPEGGVATRVGLALAHKQPLGGVLGNKKIMQIP